VCANMCNIAYWNNAAYRYLREQAQSCRSSGVCLFRNTGACTWNDCVSACALKCLHSVHMSAFSSHVCMCAQTSAFRSHVCMCSQVSAFRSHVCICSCIPFTCLHVLKRLHSVHMSACALKCLHVCSSVCIPFTCLHVLSNVCMCAQAFACALKCLHVCSSVCIPLTCLHVLSSVCIVITCLHVLLHSVHMSACAQVSALSAL